jgi:peroxiredoxin-like protein
VSFEGGQNLQGTAAPAFNGKAEHANPEELLVAALSSCHMLTFLAVAAKSQLTVDSYEDRAVGTLEKNANGKMAVTKVVLKPKIVFGGSGAPDPTRLKELHAKAHANCMIANSVACQVLVEPA